MSRRADTPCSKCGRLLWGGTTSLPAGRRICQPCRRARPDKPAHPIKSRGFCAGCATWYESTGSGVRYCSIQCHNRATVHLRTQSQAPLVACPICGKAFKRTHDRTRFCSKRCYAASLAGDGCWPDGTWAWRSLVEVGQCAVCGDATCVRAGRQLICGTCRRVDYRRAYYAANRDKFIASAHRRARRMAGAFVENVNPSVVYERDKWICHLCGEPTLRKPRWKRDPLMASLDHVIPISRGGDHSYANVACSHLRCNYAKGNRGGGEQLALVG